MAKKFLKQAIKHPGALRATAKRMGLISGDETLSQSDLDKLKAKGGKTAQRARLAETMKKFPRKKKA